MVILGIYVETYRLYRYFWDDKQGTQNIHAFSIYEIVEPMLIIVHNVIFHLRAFF